MTALAPPPCIDTPDALAVGLGAERVAVPEPIAVMSVPALMPAPKIGFSLAPILEVNETEVNSMLGCQN